MESNQHLKSVKTQFLIISDTHGMEFAPAQIPCQHVDVAIHCGDLTEESKLDEFRASIRLLNSIQASLKLVIAGNHDFTMDVPLFRQKVADVKPPLDPALVRKSYGEYGEAKKVLEEGAGVVFLDEGTHEFLLKNGALLTVYASPWTPSLGDWGFQYRRDPGHEFSIPKGVDLVITHGPPRGIMDHTESRVRAGCPALFRAVARAQPRMHCFGHIHEGWGATLVTWRELLTEAPSHCTDIDNERSIVVEKLSGLGPSNFDTQEAQEARTRKIERCRQDRCYTTSHCTEDMSGKTLFVNAAIKGTGEQPMQLPWLVELELPEAGERPRLSDPCSLQKQRQTLHHRRAHNS
ncbi:MAG: hypothetical protein Q9202_002184 [Teloschistes flavicans]